MELKKINEILKNISRIKGSKTCDVPDLGKLVRIKKETIHEMIDGEEQGGWNEYEEIFSIPGEEIFLKLNIQTDSYGSNDHISKIQFVKESKKTVIVYEYE